MKTLSDIKDELREVAADRQRLDIDAAAFEASLSRPAACITDAVRQFNALSAQLLATHRARVVHGVMTGNGRAEYDRVADVIATSRAQLLKGIQATVTAVSEQLAPLMARARALAEREAALIAERDKLNGVHRALNPH